MGVNSDERDRANRLMARAADLLTGLDDPGAARCAAALAGTDHPRLPLGSFEIIANNLDLDREWWALVLLADGAFHPTPAPSPTYLARLVETADRVGSPTLVVETDLLLGHQELDKRPPDFAAADVISLRARNLARQIGDLVAEGECLRAMAITAVGLGAGDSLEACHNAMAKLYETRYWYRIWQVFISSALALSSANIEAASTIVGFLATNTAPVAIEDQLGFRDRTVDIVRADPRGEEWMARGAAMDRHEIVQFALAALESGV